jgi:hypothetical protein
MAKKVLVGTYESHPDAEDTKRELLDEGFHDSQVNVHAPQAAAASAAHEEPKAQRGLAGFIARMFGDLMPDKADHERYERALRTGSSLVTVHGLDQTGVERAKPILAQRGEVDEHPPER